MLLRSLLFAGLFLLSGCADDGYYGGNARSGTVTSQYYDTTSYTAPYLPGSPVYGAPPYVNGPVMGGIYYYGDDDDRYGGPTFSPFHGILCDRRRQACWGRDGPDARWTGRFFGRRHSNGDHADWNQGGGNHGHWNNGGGNNQGNNRPWVYQVPKNPDGSGAPTYLPNGCGANGQPPC